MLFSFFRAAICSALQAPGQAAQILRPHRRYIPGPTRTESWKRAPCSLRCPRQKRDNSCRTRPDTVVAIPRPYSGKYDDFLLSHPEQEDGWYAYPVRHPGRQRAASPPRLRRWHSPAPLPERSNAAVPLQSAASFRGRNRSRRPGSAAFPPSTDHRFEIVRPHRRQRARRHALARNGAPSRPCGNLPLQRYQSADHANLFCPRRHKIRHVSPLWGRPIGQRNLHRRTGAL